MENELPTRVQSEQLAKRVVHMYQNVFNKDSKKTWLHFRKEGCARATIKIYIKNYGESENVNFKKSPGPKPLIATPRKLKSIENFFDENPSTPVAAAAKKLKVNKNYFQNIKLHKLGNKSYTKQSAAKHTEVQEKSVTERLPKLYNKILRKIVVMYYESYVLQDPQENPGRQFFHAKDPPQEEIKEKIKCTTKFPKKYLIWLC